MLRICIPGPALGKGTGEKMELTWPVTGTHCSSGERTHANIVKIEGFSRTRWESREGGLRRFGAGMVGKKADQVRSREGIPGAGTHGQRPGGGQCGVVHGAAHLEQHHLESGLGNRSERVLKDQLKIFDFIL